MPSQILEQLHERLRGSVPNLTLDASSLGSSHIPGLWGTDFSTETLTVAGATISSAEDRLVVKGIVPSLLNVEDLPIEITFFEAADGNGGGQLECLLSADLPLSWNFLQTYPDMPATENFSPALFGKGRQPSFFKELDFAQPRLLFSSFDFPNEPTGSQSLLPLNGNNGLEKVYQGLNYLGDLDLRGPLEPIQALVGEGRTLPIRGYLDEGEDATELYLETSLEHEVSLGPVTLKLSHLILYSSVSDEPEGASSGIELHGSLSLGDVSVELSTYYVIGGSILIFEGAFENLALPGLGDLAALMGGEDLASQLPAPLSELGDLSLADISLTISLKTKTIRGLTFGVKTSKEWTVVPELLSLKDILLRWDVESPFDKNRAISFQASGVYELDGTDIQVTARMPDFEISGGLAPGDTVNLANLFARFLPGVPDLPPLALLDLSVSANPKAKTFSLYLEIASDWVLPLGDNSLALTALVLDLRHAERTFSGSIKGVVDINGVIATITAELPSSEEGWVFNASIPEINFSDIAEQFLSAVALPVDLPDFEFADVQLRLAPKTGAISLSAHSVGEWDMGLEGLKISEVNLSFDRTVTPGVGAGRPTGDIRAMLSITCTGAVNVAEDISLDGCALGFNFDQGTSWSASGSASATLFGNHFALSVAVAQTKLDQTRSLNTYNFSWNAVQPVTIINIPDIASLSLSNLILSLQRSVTRSADPATTSPPPPTTPPEISTTTTSAPVSGTASGETVTSPNIAQTPPQATTTTMQTPPGTQWSFSGVGEMKIDSGFHCVGKLELLATEQRKGLVFTSPDARLNLDVPLVPGEPGPKLSFIINLQRISILKDGVAGWAFESAAILSIKGLPEAVDKVLPDNPLVSFRADRASVSVTASRLLEGVKFPLPSVNLESSDVELVTGSFNVLNFRLTVGARPAFAATLELTLPDEINHLFGTEAGKPRNKILNNRIVCALGIDPVIGFFVQPLPPLFAKENVKVEGGKAWSHLDFGPLGEVRYVAPMFATDGANFRASGEFEQVRPLRLPLGFVKKLLASSVGKSLAETIPDTIPLKQISVLHDDKLDFEALLGVLLELGNEGGINLRADLLRPALELMAARFNRLPANFRDYLEIEIPTHLKFDVAVTPGAGMCLRLDLRTRNGEPLKFIYPTPDGFNGVKLRRFSFGEILSGSLAIAQIDAELDCFDFLTLAACLALPTDPTNLLPDSTDVHRKFIMRELFMVIIYQTGLPIVVPVFYDELGFDALGFEGLGAGVSFRFPTPGLSELTALCKEMGPFLTDAHATLAPENSAALSFGVNPGYVRLPEYLGGGTLGAKGELFAISLAGLTARMLNALKTGSLAQLLPIIPLDKRVGLVATKLGFISFDAAWALAVSSEFKSPTFGAGEQSSLVQKFKALPQEQMSEMLDLAGAGSSRTLDAGDEESAVVLLMGGWEVSGLFKFNLRLGLTQSAEAGFGCGFAIDGQIGDLIYLSSRGRVVVNRKASAPDSKPGVQPRAPSADSQSVFSIGGECSLWILGKRIFEGSATIAENEISIAGNVDLFPGNPRLRVTGVLAGSISETLFRLGGSTKVELAGLVLREAQATISHRRMGTLITKTMMLRGAWLGVLMSLNVKQEASSLSLFGQAQFAFALQINFESVSKNISGQRVKVAEGWRLDLNIVATVKVAINNSGFTAQGSAKFKVNGADMMLEFRLVEAPRDIDALKQQVERVIKESPDKLFDAAFPDAGKWLEGVRSGAFKWTRAAYEDTGKVLRQSYNQTKDQAAQSFKAAGYTVEERTKALHTAYQVSANETIRYMDDIEARIDREKKRILAASGYVSEQQFEKAQREVHTLGMQGMLRLGALNASIQKVCQQGAQDAAKILKTAGYEIVAITGTFKDVFKVSGDRAAAEILNVTGYNAEESANALRAAYNTSANNVGKYMGEIWRKSDKEVEKILGRAGYKKSEVEDAMKEVFDWGGKVANKVDPRNW